MHTCMAQGQPQPSPINVIEKGMIYQSVYRSSRKCIKGKGKGKGQGERARTRARARARARTRGKGKGKDKGQGKGAREKARAKASAWVEEPAGSIRICISCRTYTTCAVTIMWYYSDMVLQS